MRVGLLTGGGDAPGLNGVIRACSFPLLEKGVELVGIQDAFEGIFSGSVCAIDYPLLRDIHLKPGTILGTSNEFSIDGREEETCKHFAKLKLDGLIAMGGDGTFRQLEPLADRIPLIAVPKTIDNDLQGTELTFGFNTACSVVVEALERLKFTARAHKRWLVVETMGRDTGWIALGSAIGAYADAVLVPEFDFNKDEFVNFIKTKNGEQRGGVIVVAEGLSQKLLSLKSKTQPKKSVAAKIAELLEDEAGVTTRYVVLGHLQRGGDPTLYDKWITSQMGTIASDLVLQKKWGTAVVYRSGYVVEAPIKDVMGPPRIIEKNSRYMTLAQKQGIYVNS